MCSDIAVRSWFIDGQILMNCKILNHLEHIIDVDKYDLVFCSQFKIFVTSIQKFNVFLCSIGFYSSILALGGSALIPMLIQNLQILHGSTKIFMVSHDRPLQKA